MTWPISKKSSIRQIKAWYYRIDLTNPLRFYNGLPWTRIGSFRGRTFAINKVGFTTVFFTENRNRLHFFRYKGWFRRFNKSFNLIWHHFDLSIKAIAVAAASDNKGGCRNWLEAATVNGVAVNDDLKFRRSKYLDINSLIHFHQFTNIFLTKFGVMIILMMLWNAFWCSLEI